MRIASLGHAVFAAVIIFIGILGLVRNDYGLVWYAVPKDFPARELLPYFYSLISLAAGLGLLWRRTAAPAARLLLIYLLSWMLLFKLRYILMHAGTEVYYESWGETAVQVAAAWVLYSWFAEAWDKRNLAFATGDRGLRIARVIYGLAMIAFGLSHFAYLGNTASLVPGWLPGHVYWAYFTGSAYLAAGVAVLVGLYGRLAAAFSAVQMGGFTLLVWVPVVAKGTHDPSMWGEFVVSMALAASGWVMADSYRGTPWLRPFKPKAI